ncbi:ABC transporter permease [Celeribacter indicus]|uniref:ABC transporter permease n=1 Tax=Celeribacter indicus TaxID=1208324 RepID=A0A0B5E0U6_9RHOB|nr:ABC transporter permease [Celeribacter indicus]AJE47040.1 ABC transporter permease [Celeribacter indicus]SDW92331.1 putative spermidine/putrescine transport system permease protein [Celeribacter indicus]
MNEINPVPFAFRLLAGLALLVLLVPVAIVVMAGLNSGEYLTFPPEGISLRWVKGFFVSPTFLPAFKLSFGLALVTTLVSTVLGTLAAVFLTRTRSRARELLRGLFILPVILPGVVLGLALYVFYIWTDIGLARSLTGLLIGHVLVTMPFVIATVTASLVDFDLSIEEAARALGATAAQAFVKVTLPNIASGITAGTIFAFIVSFGQFELTLFLSTPDLQTLPIAMYTSLRYAFEPTAAAAGIFAIFLVTVSTLLTSRLVNLKKMLRRR